ncbi:MAG: HAD family phosphatase [Selenomonadaceae bacterium]|nr:HAD family phosphatase [Selenomonadaceae bacterium]MBQ7630432.1 HAD family phosphatase [Selenomonadaceae bacterium]
MSVKIILSDIDGTFLTDDKKVTDLTAQAAKSVVEKNLPLVLVSARMPEAIYPITDGIGLPRQPVISYSGGLVLTEDEKVLHDKKMSLDDTKNILAEMDKRWVGLCINYYSGRNWYVRAVEYNVQHEMEITQAKAEVADFYKLIDENILPNKIMIICTPPTCKEMESVLGELFPRLNVVRSAPYLLEIMDKSVSKAVGIEILLKHYKISVDDAIAFGDNYNDIEMLQYIPCSVAMKNAPDKVKQIAREVTDSNADSGIYTYLVKNKII